MKLLYNDGIKEEFSYLEHQSFKMSPESEHDNPWLFLIDKKILQEILVPAEKGKTHISGIGSDRSQSIEDFLKGLLDR